MKTGASLLITLLCLTLYAHAQTLQRVNLHGRPADLNFAPGEENLESPLIVLLHGAYGNSIQFQFQSSVLRGTSEAGLRVALLNGQAWSRPTQPGNRTWYGQMRSWNADWCCWLVAGDDLTYIETTISTLQTGVSGNGNKVIAVGHSHGAMMAYYFMCQKPNVLHGVLGVSGLISFERCQNSDTRVIHVHGDADTTVPITGDNNLSDGKQFQTLGQQWALFNNTEINDTTFIVERASHEIDDIDRKLKAQFGFNLADLAIGLANY